MSGSVIHNHVAPVRSDKRLLPLSTLHAASKSAEQDFTFTSLLMIGFRLPQYPRIRHNSTLKGMVNVVIMTLVCTDVKPNLANSAISWCKARRQRHPKPEPYKTAGETGTTANDRQNGDPHRGAPIHSTQSIPLFCPTLFPRVSMSVELVNNLHYIVPHYIIQYCNIRYYTEIRWYMNRRF